MSASRLLSAMSKRSLEDLPVVHQPNRPRQVLSSASSLPTSPPSATRAHGGYPTRLWCVSIQVL